jgi:ribosomal protein S18 acetylase RimI-like enzyme
MDELFLIFEPISRFAPGDLAEIVARSYAALVESSPEVWGREREKWEDFDRRAFASPDTVGRCVFVSRFGPEPVGLGSYDPRPGPVYGEIGQNCVLPEFRGRGFGSRQVREILGRFETLGIRTARVTTSGHPFFEPARRMYEGLGFREIRRFAGGPDPGYPLIELARELDRPSELDR